jgi:hypothetical protein
VPILVQQGREGQIGFALSIADHEINYLGEGCTSDDVFALGSKFREIIADFFSGDPRINLHRHAKAATVTVPPQEMPDSAEAPASI